MTDVVVRWGGPADATSGSTYKVERTLDNSAWTTLAAAQAASSPYASVSGTLNGDAAYGATSIELDNAAAFGTSGLGWLGGEALVEWTGKTSNTLTGVVWHSGYGTYTDGSALMVAQESYTDAGVTVTNNAVLYRITHINASGQEAAPAYYWHHFPPGAASSRHCVVIVNVKTDLGVETRAGISVQCYLAADTNFDITGGAHLDARQSSVMTQATNVFGLAFFQCWRSSARSPASNYTFRLDSGASTVYEVAVASIPDRDWVLLEDLL